MKPAAFLRAASAATFCLLTSLPLAVLAQGQPSAGANAGAGAASGGGARAMPPLQVATITMAKESVPRTFSLPGRAVAYQQVQIRPRVGGLVTEILYTPGKPLKAGDPLFKLDDASYVAAVASNTSDYLKAQADLPVKQGNVDRAQRLLNAGSTQVQLESAQADLAAAKATLDATKAALDYAQTQLSWTTVTSPIDGIPEVAAVSVGDLVAAGQANALTTITRLDPINVDMLETSARLLQIRSQIDDGTLSPNQSINATLMLEDGQTYSGRGRMIAPSALVSTTTGTITVRFQFDNPQHMILPGMFVNGTADLGRAEAYLVPQRAATHAANGDLTAFIVKDGKAQPVTMTAQTSYQNNWVVTSGLSDGDQLIVDGLKTLSAGREVQALPATLDADGLVQPIAANATTNAPAGAATAPASAPNAETPPATPANAPASSAVTTSETAATPSAAPSKTAE